MFLVFVLPRPPPPPFHSISKVSLTKVSGSSGDLSVGFSVLDVGYNPEIYVGDERTQGGLRIVRDADGHPIKEVFEVNESL